MKKRVYQMCLVALLAVVLVAMVLQFIYFGKEGYWITVAVLIGAWLASKALQKYGYNS